MTPEELEKQVKILTRVVGNHSVMLHSLKESVQSIRELRDPSDSVKFQIYEIVSRLGEWADECDESFTDLSKFTVNVIHDSTPFLVCDKCGHDCGIAKDDTLSQMAELAKAHKCPERERNEG